MNTTKINPDFRLYLEEAIGKENSLIAFSAFNNHSSTSIRFNPLKYPKGWESDMALIESHFGQTLKPIQWSKHGYILGERPSFTLDPLFHSGAYYVQDSSSMFVGEVFRKVLSEVKTNSARTRNEDCPLRVLDLCAAPGGKTTDLAASLREVYGDNFILVANEVIKSRASILADNIAIWGDPNIVVTNEDPSKLAELEGYFDIILADVPCSGEGMFRKDDQAISLWSKDNVSLCQSRSRRILADIWSALAPNGTLIYSTCTFNRYENDDNIEWLKKELGASTDFELPKMAGILETKYGRLLVPGFVSGEGQYCSVARKDNEETGKNKTRTNESKKGINKSKNEIKGMDKTILSMAQSLINIDIRLELKGDLLKAIPKRISDELNHIENKLRPLSSGLALAKIKGKTLVPHPDLALSYIFSPDVFPRVELEKEQALLYLSHETLTFPDKEKSYLDLRYLGLGLGFVKNLGTRVNSLHPLGRRIRMNWNK